MSRITSLRTGRKDGKRVNLYLDGGFAFSLYAETAAQEGLQVGQELADDTVARLVRTDQQRRALDLALRYLGYRPRSEAEVRQRLQRRGFPPEAVEGAAARLKELGMLDDAAFARFWVDNRDTFRPRSRRLTGLELARMGIDREVIAAAVQGGDDEENAYRAASGKAAHLPADYAGFRRRLGDYLRRRGFSYEVIGRVVAKVWQEHKDGYAPD